MIKRMDDVGFVVDDSVTTEFFAELGLDLSGQMPVEGRRVDRIIGLDGVAGARACSKELVGELERYEDSYRLCYVRGPERIIVELAEQIG